MTLFIMGLNGFMCERPLPLKGGTRDHRAHASHTLVRADRTGTHTHTRAPTFTRSQRKRGADGGPCALRRGRAGTMGGCGILF